MLSRAACGPRFVVCPPLLQTTFMLRSISQISNCFTSIQEYLRNQKFLMTLGMQPLHFNSMFEMFKLFVSTKI